MAAACASLHTGEGGAGASGSRPRAASPGGIRDDSVPRAGTGSAQAHSLEGAAAPQETPQVEDWNPLAGPAARLRDAAEGLGISYQWDVGVSYQRADQVDSGQHAYTSLIWQNLGAWTFLETALGASSIGWALEGTIGLDYNPSHESLAGGIGSSSALNAAIIPDTIAVDELFLRQQSSDQRFLVQAGMVDLSNQFDTNRIANDTFSEFAAAALENNPSIPFPAFGGAGGLARFQSAGAYVMAGTAGSSVTAAAPPWSTADGDWYQLVEVGLQADWKRLGQGTYRLTPWHNHREGEDGWGLGLNLDQELGTPAFLGFARLGLGDRDVTPVEAFVSAGFTLEGILDREHDGFGVAFATSDPSPGFGRRTETLLESYYRIQLSPTVQLSPLFHVVFDPAQRDERETVFTGGLRLRISL